LIALRHFVGHKRYRPAACREGGLGTSELRMCWHFLGICVIEEVHKYLSQLS